MDNVEDLLRWGTDMIHGFVREAPTQPTQLGRAELDSHGHRTYPGGEGCLWGTCHSHEDTGNKERATRISGTHVTFPTEPP